MSPLPVVNVLKECGRSVCKSKWAKLHPLHPRAHQLTAPRRMVYPFSLTSHAHFRGEAAACYREAISTSADTQGPALHENIRVGQQ